MGRDRIGRGREGKGEGWEGEGGWSKVKEGEMVRGRRGRKKGKESGCGRRGKKYVHTLRKKL